MKSVTCSRGKSLVECHPFGDQIVRGLLLPTFMYKTWPDQKGLVNEERMPSPTCSQCPPLQM